MRKSLLVPVAVLGVVVLGGVAAPFYYGSSYKSLLEKEVAAVPPTPGLKIEIANYEKGWLSSHAQLKVTVDTNAQRHPAAAAARPPVPAPFGNITMLVDAKIKHGPILQVKDSAGKSAVKFGKAAVLTTLNFDGPSGQMVQAVIGEQPVLQGISVIGFNNKNVTEYYNQGIQFDQGGVKFAWDGLHGKWHYDKANGILRQTMEITPMNGSGPDGGKFEMAAMTMDQDFSKAPEGVWVGDFHLKLPEINLRDIPVGGHAHAYKTVNGETKRVNTVSEMTKRNVVIKDVGLDANSDVRLGLLNSKLMFNLASVDVDNVNYGPVDFSLTVKNLDAEAIGEFQTWMEEHPNPSQQAGAKVAMKYMPKIFGKGALFSLDKLNVGLPQGTIALNGHVKLPRMQGDRPNIFMLMMGVEALLNVKAPKAIVKSMLERKIQMQRQQQAAYAQYHQGQTTAPDKAVASAPEMPADQAAEHILDQWLAQGFMEEKEGIYEMRFTYQGGQPLLNGRPLPQMPGQASNADAAPGPVAVAKDLVTTRSNNK